MNFKSYILEEDGLEAMNEIESIVVNVAIRALANVGMAFGDGILNNIRRTNEHTIHY